MKTLHPLSIVGGILAALGLALAFTEYGAFAPWICLAAGFVAEKGIGNAASVPRIGAMLFAQLSVGAACAAVGLPWLGLGLALAVLGAHGRLPFVSTLGAVGLWWLDPLLGYSGLALAVASALQAGGWQVWVFVAYVAFLCFGVTMGVVMHLKMLAKTKGGYAVEPGGTAPDFNLTDETGFPVSLSSFRGRSHVLLIFVRGDWCPSCHITLRTYARHKDRFQEKGIVLLAIGPDPVGVNLRMVQDLGVPYKMLSDEGQKTAMAYGVQMGDDFSKKMMPDGVPLPASFLVDKDGIVRYTSRPERAGEFLDPNTIFPVLQTIAA